VKNIFLIETSDIKALNIMISNRREGGRKGERERERENREQEILTYQKSCVLE